MRTFETFLLILLRGWLVLSQCPNGCTCTRFWVGCFLGDLHQHLPSLQSSVERLELMHSNISTLSRETVGIQNLKELYMEKTAVVDIRRGAFLDSRDLVKLIVKSGRLRVIQRGAFAGLDRLRLLDLSDNRLTGMASGSLDGIASLFHLDLSSNTLHSVPSDVLDYFSPIADEDVLVYEVKLELSGNLLRKLVFYNYKISATLTNLQLSVNRLSGIYRGMFQGLVDLQILSLKDNLISSIQPGSFYSLSNLQVLDIAENKVQRIDQGTLKGLSKLRYLHLDDNPLKSVEPKAFLDLSSLHTITMKRTGIHLLEPDTFKGLKNLQFLDLSWTNVSKIEPETFQHFLNLTYLKLTRPSAINSYSTVDKLHLETFVGLTKLNVLIFKTGLKMLQPKMFVHLKALIELDLSKLSDFDSAFIETVHAEAFVGLSLLRKLDLNGNSITHLHNGTFSPLKRLNYLDLSGNPLLKIGTAALQGLSHMRFIGLSLRGTEDLRGIFKDAEIIESLRLEDPDNTCFDLQYRAVNLDAINDLTVFSLEITCYGIEVLKKNIFKDTKALKKLNLGWNGIRTLQKDSLVEVPNLLELKLYQNSISSIEPGSFNGVPTLMHLEINSNNLSLLRGDEFSTTNCSIACGLPSLQYLDLSYNKISYIDVKTFSAMKSLLTLILSNNMLSSFHLNTLRHNRRLQILKLDNNELFHFDNLVFPQSIQELDFHNCNVTSVQSLYGLINLRVLNFSFNSLVTLQYGIVGSLAGLRHLELSENPLVCDCELQKTWNWLQSYEINSLYAIRCDGIEGWSWDEPLSQLKCETPVVEEYIPKPRVNLLADIEFFRKYVEPVVLFLILMIGLTGNGLLLFIFVRHNELRSGPNLCILNMALADVLSLIVNLPLSYAESQMSWTLEVTACKIYRFLRDLTVGLTVFSVVTLALQRQRVTSEDSFKVHDNLPCLHIKPDFAYPLIAWIFSVSFSLSALMTATVEDEMCLYVTEKNIGMDLWKIWLYQLIIFCVIPICVVCYAYIRTARNLKNSVRHLPESAKYSVQARRRLAVARMSVVLMAVFVVSYAPNFVLRILVAWSVMEPWSKITVYASFVSYCLFFVMSCFNPVALYMMSSEYKTLFRRYLCRATKVHKS